MSSIGSPTPLSVATIIKAVMSSAAEAELGAYTYQNGPPTTKNTNPNRQLDGGRGSQQQNQPKRTKAMDMRFHWLQDPEAQDQLRIYWRSGKTNLADYFTKNHSSAHHLNVRTHFFNQSQRSSRSKTSATRTRTYQFQINKKLNSYKGVLKFRTRTYLCTYGSHIGNS